MPDIWLDTPDSFEAGSVRYLVEEVAISKITEVAWTVNKTRKQYESNFRNGIKMPLILVERLGNIYELHDGQHRFAAYRSVFPHLKKIRVASFCAIKST